MLGWDWLLWSWIKLLFHPLSLPPIGVAPHPTRPRGRDLLVVGPSQDTTGQISQGTDIFFQGHQ